MKFISSIFVILLVSSTQLYAIDVSVFECKAFCTDHSDTERPFSRKDRELLKKLNAQSLYFVAKDETEAETFTSFYTPISGDDAEGLKNKIQHIELYSAVFSEIRIWEYPIKHFYNRCCAAEV